MLAEELREIHAYGQDKMAEQVFTTDDFMQIMRRMLKGRS
jgi:hypothetical protein